MTPVPRNQFWITNFSKKSVHLYDLGVDLAPGKSANLLDRRHYSISVNQIIESLRDGTLAKKKDQVAVRRVLPEAVESALSVAGDEAIIPTRRRSAVQVEEVRYEELEFNDDTFFNNFDT